LSRRGTRRKDDPLDRQFVSPPRKSKGLHKGKEDWEWARAATKSCGRDVRLPTADDDQYCSTPTKERLCLIGASPVAKQVERHHFLLADRCAIITFFSTFSIFSTFRFWILGQAIHQHQHIPLTYRHISSLIRTHLKHRSVYSQGISYIVVATSLSPRFGPSEKGSLARAWALHGSLQM
jgi:hypothetical protein